MSDTKAKKNKPKIMNLYWRIEKELDHNLEKAVEQLEMVTCKKLKKENCK